MSGVLASARALALNAWASSRTMRRPLFGAFVAGAIAFLLLGATPGRKTATAGVAPEWALVAPVPPDVLAASQALQASPLWASQPVAPVASLAAEPPPPPPAVALGVFRQGSRLEALFLMPDGRRVRGAPGETLPNGDVVVEVAPTRVRWRTADGKDHDVRLFDQRAS